MTRQRPGRIAAIGTVVIVGCLALSAWIVVRFHGAGTSPAVPSAAMRPRPSFAAAVPGQWHEGRAMTSAPKPLSACEARIEHQQHRLHP